MVFSKLFGALCVCLLVSSAWGADATRKWEDWSYLLGQQLGQQYRSSGVPLDSDILIVAAEEAFDQRPFSRQYTTEELAEADAKIGNQYKRYLRIRPASEEFGGDFEGDLLPPLEIDKTLASFALGRLLGDQFGPSQRNWELNFPELKDGFTNAMSFQDGRMSADQAAELDDEFKKDLGSFRQKLIDGKAMINLRASETWLDENKQKEGVITTASGLQYKVLKSNPSGEKIAKDDIVGLLYKGMKADRKVFDEKSDREKQIKYLTPSDTIEGWKEALGLMRVGERWELYLHPSFAYGRYGLGKRVLPNDVLIFELEVVNLIPVEYEDLGGGLPTVEVAAPAASSPAAAAAAAAAPAAGSNKDEL